MVLGISLVFALVVSSVFYMITARLRAAPQPKKTQTATMVVAASSLPVGKQIQPEDLRLATVPKDRLPAGAFQRIEEVVGRPVISPILPDEPVVAGRLGERGSGFGLAPVIPPGMRAVAVRVNEVVGVAGFVIPGMRVDVLVTVRPPGDAEPRTATVLQNIVVAAAGQQIQPDASGRAVNVPVVTLLVTPEQAEILTLAGSEGRIQLVLRNAADQQLAQTPGRELSELYGKPKTAVRSAPKRAPSAPALVAKAETPPPPDDQVLVIRGSQVSVEKVNPRAGEQAPGREARP
jgi:pilus assembly protein CpaB